MRWTTSVLIVAHYFFSTLLTENYTNAFESVKVIIQNIVNPDTVKTVFLLRSQLRQHYVVIC